MEKIVPKQLSAVGMEATDEFVRRWRKRLETDGAFAVTACVGDRRLLGKPATALLCSVKCPGNVILKTYDLMRAWRDAGVTVISGFHSPMEKECLRILMRGTQPTIICPARSVVGMRIPREWRKPVEAGRLLILSPFDQRHRRATAQLAQQRNEFVAALADRVFVAYAAPGSKTEDLCRKVISFGKPLLTFDSPANEKLIRMGAECVGPITLAEKSVNES